VLEAGRFHRERILVEYEQVGELAGLERAAIGFFHAEVGAVHGRALEGFRARDPLAGRDDGVGVAVDALDRLPDARPHRNRHVVRGK